jgi:hypothetical protein
MDNQNRNKVVQTARFRVWVNHCGQNGRGLEKTSIILNRKVGFGSGYDFVGAEELDAARFADCPAPYSESTIECLCNLLKRLSLSKAEKKEIMIEAMQAYDGGLITC